MSTGIAALICIWTRGSLSLGFTVTPLSLWQVDFGLLIPEGGMVLGGNLVGEVVELGEELESEGQVKIGSMVSDAFPATAATAECSPTFTCQDHGFPVQFHRQEASTRARPS